MKTFNLVAIALIAASAIFLSPGHARAQDQIPSVDSTLRDTASQLPAPATKDTVMAPAAGPIIAADHIGSIPLPAWLQTSVIALFTLLPAVQLVLKRIPTTYSVKITGVIGKILDALTFFQQDRSQNGGVHK